MSTRLASYLPITIPSGDHKMVIHAHEITSGAQKMISCDHDFVDGEICINFMSYHGGTWWRSGNTLASHL